MHGLNIEYYLCYFAEWRLSLSGLPSKDDWDFVFNGYSNAPFIKTNYPHPMGVWSWGSEANQVALVIQYIRRSLVEYADIQWYMSFENDYNSDREVLEQMYGRRLDTAGEMMYGIHTVLRIIVFSQLPNISIHLFRLLRLERSACIGRNLQIRVVHRFLDGEWSIQGKIIFVPLIRFMFECFGGILILSISFFTRILTPTM